ncbi:MAG: hypothetical protein ACK4UN_09375 [Limisphaerales bacterium]
MNVTGRVDLFELEHVRPFQAVIVYEDEGAFQRVLPIFQRLIQEFAGETQFRCVWLSYNNLENRKIAEDASDKAAQADMVIFSARSAELPVVLREWVENWLPRKDLDEGALAAIVDPQTIVRGRSPLLSYLKGVADRGRLEFLSGFKNVQYQMEAPLAIRPASEYATAPVPNHWGINE